MAVTIAAPFLGKARRRTWPKARLSLVQIGLAAVLATAVAMALGHSVPWFAPLTAVFAVQVLCAPHRRALWLFLFGEINGMLIGTMFNPAWSTRAAALDALIGALAAVAVAVATMPQRPVQLINEAMEPVLSRLAKNTRAVANALRAGDANAAADALHDLNDVEDELARLKEVLVQLRRSAMLTRWRSGHNLDIYKQATKELGFAVRDIRTLTRHAWWGVLRSGEPVPHALPRMLDTLADALAVLRDEIAGGGQLTEAKPLLISAARWVEIMREQPLSISAAAVAASADAAVLDLLIAIGIPLHDADHIMRRPPTTRPV